MDRHHNQGLDLRCLLLMPSFYGGAAWTITLALYWTRYVEWNPDSTVSIIVFLGVALSFFCSTLFFLPRYQQFAAREDKARIAPGPRELTHERAMPAWLLLLHGVGLVGVVFYARSMSLHLGGTDTFFWLIRNASWQIRAAGSESTSIGTQIAYFGWIAATITVYRCFNGKLEKKWLWLVVLQIAGNTLWISRIRPLTIIFLCYAVFLLTRRRWNLTRTMLINGVMCLACILGFVAIGVWVGKINLGEGSNANLNLLPAANSAYHYLTSPYAYCNDVLVHDTERSDTPQTLYPGAKVLEACGLLNEASSQIYDFRKLPYRTNVGTYLVAFYWDGGWPYLVLGILFYSFGLDLLGWWYLSARNDFSKAGWALCCWVACMAFFAPKITATETWLFFTVAALGAITTEISLTFRLSRAWDGFANNRSVVGHDSCRQRSSASLK